MELLVRYAEGKALVTHQTISGWGGIDPMTGTVIETHHELRGVSFRTRCWCFPEPKDRPDLDPLAIIETGDWVKVDGDRGVVEITKRRD